MNCQARLDPSSSTTQRISPMLPVGTIALSDLYVDWTYGAGKVFLSLVGRNKSHFTAIPSPPSAASSAEYSGCRTNR
jgi:hypothetical protein